MRKEERIMANAKTENDNNASNHSCQDFELWKHFSSIGGADKDRMVTIETWLLTFSGAIIGYSGTAVNAKKSIVILAILGIIVSFAAGWVVLLYGAYSNWNWAKADYIARKNKWEDLIPSQSFPSNEAVRPKFLGCLELWIVKKIGKPHDPSARLGSVFRGFIILSVLSLVIHVLLLFSPKILGVD